MNYFLAKTLASWSASWMPFLIEPCIITTCFSRWCVSQVCNSWLRNSQQLRRMSFDRELIPLVINGINRVECVFCFQFLMYQTNQFQNICQQKIFTSIMKRMATTPLSAITLALFCMRLIRCVMEASTNSSSLFLKICDKYLHNSQQQKETY